MVQEPAVRRRLSVVELVDDHDVEVLGVDVSEARRRQRLHAGEDVPPRCRRRAVDEQLTEGGIGQHLAVGAQRLLQDLPAVSHEQQPRLAPGGRLLAQPPEVQRRYDGLAGARGGDHEVAVPVVHDALDVEGLEDLQLVRARHHLQPGDGDHRARRAGAALGGQSAVEQVGVAVRVVVEEAGVVPVGVERRLELAHQRRRRHRGDAHVPLQAVDQRGLGEVGAADVPGVEARGAPEQPRLGVQARGLSVVTNLHLCPETAHELVERPALGGAAVGGGDDAHRHTALAQLGQRLLQYPDAVPADEGAQQVHSLSAAHLRPQLGAEVRLPAAVGEQCDVGQRGHRALARPRGVDAGTAQRDQLLDVDHLLLRATLGEVEQLVDVVAPLIGPEAGEHAADGVGDVTGEDVRRRDVGHGCVLGLQGRSLEHLDQALGDQRLVRTCSDGLAHGVSFTQPQGSGWSLSLAAAAPAPPASRRPPRAAPCRASPGSAAPCRRCAPAGPPARR